MATPLKREIMKTTIKYGNWIQNFRKSILGYFRKDSIIYNNCPDWYILPRAPTKKLEDKLNKMGLLYDDYAWTDKKPTPDMALAMSMLEPEVREMRQRRVDRANDMGLKHTSIPEHMWNHQGKPLDPANMYLTPIISKIKLEKKLNKDIQMKYE